ncbi:MAG: hypothetical protein PHH70_03900 [Candidatus Gracilibacteria bacterium]|nr:hypothetical protein [Candidatus Gracilibacteria bacterium]
MFKFIEFLRKRPKDRTILVGRIVFGLIIALLIGLNFNDITILHLPDFVKPYELSKKLGLFIFALVPILMGLTGICIAKRKYVRIIQICFGLVLMIIGNWFIDMKVPAAQNTLPMTQSGALDYGTISESKTPSKPFNVGFWLAFLGIFPLLAGITGKCITSKCLKYGEVIKKIRV